LEPDREVKSEPIPPHKPSVTPTSQIPTPDPKDDRLSTSFKGSKPSSEISDHTPVIEKLQQENVQLLQQLEERKTMDRHLHHDNAVLQEKVNSLQRLVDKMTNDNRSLHAQLKHRKRAKTKSSGQEASKANPSPSQQV
jgi:predicted RNase H-like nuclease (RuvC/YqgF family)